jgi:serine/threonine protein kinase
VDRKALQREQQIYSKLQHLDDPAVLRVVDWERDSDSVALVTEFADGGSLADHVNASGGALSVVNTTKISLQILNSLSALHGAGIVHRDLKPDNIVLVGDIWKVADFGIAKNLSRPVTGHTFARHHTPGYAPPEQVEGSEANASADIYAFGKLMAFMLTGQTDPDKISSPACRLLARDCTQAVSTDRPTIDEIQRSLKRIVA